jgi:hypothetical protein
VAAAALVAALAADSSLASRRAFRVRLTPVSHTHSFFGSTDTDALRFSEIDSLTDRAGLGDKYDDKINKFADGQINNQIPGGAGKSSGGELGGGLGK